MVATRAREARKIARTSRRWHIAWIAVGVIAGCSAQNTGPLAAALSRPAAAQINLSRVRGTHMMVPAATADYPPLALVDGITTVDDWRPGAGWELSFDGAFARDRYFDPETDLSADEPVEWEGLRRDHRQGKEQSALAWIVFELARERVVESVTIHSVDTADMPAARFGVRDVLVQYWDSATGRWVSVVLEDGETPTRHTVTANVLARLDIDFHPVRTDLVRVAVRWTNDAVNTRSFTVMGRREEYVEATVRLTEIEVYGDRADDDELADTVSQSMPDAVPSTGAADPAGAGANEADAIMSTVLTYVEAYGARDLDLLLRTISPDYLSEGEDAEGLRTRMARTFDEFEHFLFRVTDANIESREGDHAVVAARYWLQLNPLLARSTEGVLRFALTKTGDTWLIGEIHAQAM